MQGTVVVRPGTHGIVSDTDLILRRVRPGKSRVKERFGILTLHCPVSVVQGYCAQLHHGNVFGDFVLRLFCPGRRLFLLN